MIAIVMGVSGVGKTTIGTALASALGCARGCRRSLHRRKA
jgi:gluconate kinase